MGGPGNAPLRYGAGNVSGVWRGITENDAPLIRLATIGSPCILMLQVAHFAKFNEGL